jgi:dynein heavy chain
VSEEEPELEETRNVLVKSFNGYKIQLKELEDQLLERLANAPADILRSYRRQLMRMLRNTR